MYDAKQEEQENENYKLKYDCICSRGYFEKTKNCNMINLKTSSIPLENIFY